METFTFNSTDGALVTVRSWAPENPEQPVAVVQIAHGMAEHSLRYDWFARRLVAEGFAVYANDHRGHGETAGYEDRLGHFSDQNGWTQVVRDMAQLNDLIRKKHPGLPVFLFGHSMGSLLSRDFMTRWGGSLKGVVLSGTAGHPGLRGRVGLLLAKLQALLGGGRSLSTLMDSLTFKSYNKAFAPVSSPFDWLSRDSDQVDAYIKDPYCGFICSSRFYVDVIGGAIKVNTMGHILNTPKDLPVLLVSGDMDPVGHYGKGVTRTHEAFQKAGLKDVTVKLYEDGRHEILNEINREDVADDVIAWLRARL